GDEAVVDDGETTTKINNVIGVRSVLNDLNDGGRVDGDGGGEDRWCGRRGRELRWASVVRERCTPAAVAAVVNSGEEQCTMREMAKKETKVRKKIKK
ncbi:hypothetical protein A2U01_0029578, partial [Trifolium medium]|nr:hypothetical protein [Trifolium medium]